MMEFGGHGGHRAGSGMRDAFGGSPLSPIPVKGNWEGRAGQWKVPQQGDGEQPAKLLVNNTLSHDGDLVEFVSNSGKSVNWYSCGPTVCDPPHMGHVRTYLTFDIIRRIMEDYFKYDVTFVMGITDIDDRVIARSNELMSLVGEGFSWEDAFNALMEVWGTCVCSVKTMELARALLNERCQKLPNAAATVPKVAAPAHGVPDEGVDILPLARRVEEAFRQQLSRLGTRPPTVVTRVTEYIPSIIEFVQKILGNGYAYEIDGNIFFDIQAFTKSHTYAKLMPSTAEDTIGVLTGNCEGVLHGATTTDARKRHPKDFALWKKSITGEPQWQSPWGNGRPGWHIECSAMASEILGQRFDVHSGGEDLKFPHHDCELAQSEARWNTGEPWVNYFLHHGQLHVDRNMPKKIETALEQYTPVELRMLFLLHPYDGPIMFNKASMTASREKVQFFRQFFESAEEWTASSCPTGVEAWELAVEGSLWRELQAAQKDVHGALCHNFDTASAILHLCSLCNASREYVRRRRQTGSTVRVQLLKQLQMYIVSMFRVFGLMADDQASFLRDGAEAAFADENVSAVVDAFLEFKNMVRCEVASAAGLSSEELARHVQCLCSALTEATLPQLGLQISEQCREARCVNEWEYQPPAHNGTTPSAAEQSHDKISSFLMGLPPMPPV
ncbi:Cysteine--tRNA ligase [Diplonema papillatum]|nr:Cysteine--tRNA ligase [Diplonema papillatum]